MAKGKSSITLACFSPPVMIATFALEVIMAIYVVARYKLNAKTRVVVALLVCLGAFQLAEYFVCTQSTVAIGSARGGYVAITLLPPLGLYLMSLLTKPLKNLALAGLVGITAVFVGYFLAAPRVFEAYECTGNYVIFQIGEWQMWLYGAFYFGLISLTLLKGLYFLAKKPAAKTAITIKWLILGYILFMVPVAILTVLHPDTSRAVPSLLCGFAVTMAIVLATKIVPLSAKKK